jgi:hypothetical protein
MSSGFSNTAHHCLGGEAFLCTLPIACATSALVHIGPDKSRRNRIHGYVVRAKL